MNTKEAQKYVFYFALSNMYMFPVIDPIFTDVQDSQLFQVTYTLYD